VAAIYLRTNDAAPAVWEFAQKQTIQADAAIKFDVKARDIFPASVCWSD
jgi:hypothetical protein